MKKGYKFIAIGIIVIFLGMTLSPATGQNIVNKSKEEKISVEIGSFNDEGVMVAQSFALTKDEVNELQSTLSKISEEIKYATSYSQIENILKRYLRGCNRPILCRIYSIISCVKNWIRNPTSREFVFSHGWGYKLNPFKTNDLKIRKTFATWHYSPRSIIQSRSIILRLFPFDMKVLSGRQIGMMFGFFGIFVYIARQLPQQSFTFFAGVAKHAFGFDFSVSPILIR